VTEVVNLFPLTLTLFTLKVNFLLEKTIIYAKIDGKQVISLPHMRGGVSEKRV
jgi:hypothetical protein